MRAGHCIWSGTWSGTLIEPRHTGRGLVTSLGGVGFVSVVSLMQVKPSTRVPARDHAIRPLRTSLSLRRSADAAAWARAHSRSP